MFSLKRKDTVEVMSKPIALVLTFPAEQERPRSLYNSFIFARKLFGFSMHECNAQALFLLLSCPKCWGITCRTS